MKSIHKIIVNRIKYIFFLINEKFNGDHIVKKLKKIDKIYSLKVKIKKLDNLSKKYPAHPMITFNQATTNISCENPKLGHEQIKNYDFIRDDWLKQNFTSSVYKNEFVPVCRVIGSFGNYRTLFYYLMNKINSEERYKKPNLLLKDNEKINNNTLYYYFKPYLNIIQNTSSFYKFKYLSEIFKTPIEIALPFNGSYYPWFAVENMSQQKILSKKNLKFTKFNLSKEHFLKGKEILKKIGLPENAWYATLHIREGAQNEKTFNSNPMTYLKSIKEIISRGGYVFRVGDKKMTKMPKIKGLIDYPFTEFKSEFMDVFLGATCRFGIGTSSGYWTVPVYFGKPVLLVNYLPILDYYSLGEKNIFLGKHLKNKVTGEKISIEKLFNFNIGYFTCDDQFADNNIEIVDNDENEIWESTVEILNLLDNGKTQQEFTALNLKFKEKIDLQNEKIFDFPIKALANLSSAYLRKYIN